MQPLFLQCVSQDRLCFAAETNPPISQHEIVVTHKKSMCIWVNFSNPCNINTGFPNAVAGEESALTNGQVPAFQSLLLIFHCPKQVSRSYLPFRDMKSFHVPGRREKLEGTDEQY